MFLSFHEEKHFSVPTLISSKNPLVLNTNPLYSRNILPSEHQELG